MAHILALSSWVAHGHVGLSAATPLLQILGHTVTQLPTTQLSNHPGFACVAGGNTDTEALRAIIKALDGNGWLSKTDTILTGYLPSAAHVDVAVDLIEGFKSARPRVVVDPVLGDHPKGLYIAPEAAEAVRDRLVPEADILTPNAFEVSWLTGRDVQTLHAVTQAASDLRIRAAAEEVLVTSAPFGDDLTGVLGITASAVTMFQTPSAPEELLVPHGVGDAFSAMIAAGLRTGQALGSLQTLIEHSLGGQHLRIAETASLWTKANPIHPKAFAALTDASEMG